MDNLTKFAEVLQDLLIEHNTNPFAFSKSADIHYNIVYNWLNKKSLPSLKKLVFLSDYFECSIDYLLGRTLDNYYSKKLITPFAVQLRKLIDNQNISAYKLSAKIEIPDSNLSRFLRGESEPLLDNLIKIADYFGCSVDYLVGR